MKTIGLLGGMSWESTVSYYTALNQGIKQELGGFHSAKIILNSVDFAEIETLQHQGQWDITAKLLSLAAQSIEAGGADFLLICTNTMHKVADQIQAAISIPILHIADATAEKLQKDGITRVGLLGTQFTMEQDFYKGRLTDKYGIEVIIPNLADRQSVHNIIYNDLCQGLMSETSASGYQSILNRRNTYLAIMDRLRKDGAQAVILGCTEIGLLIQPEHTDIKLYDTTEVHAEAAIRYALS